MGRRDPVPLAGWVLAPWPTWTLWRVTSYRVAMETAQRRLRAAYRLCGVYGDAWRRHVQDDLAWMLGSGVLLDEAFTLVAELTADRLVPVDGGVAVDHPGNLGGLEIWDDAEHRCRSYGRSGIGNVG